MKLWWCIPSIDPVWGDSCWTSLHPAIRERCIFVDNFTVNRGVAPSWNLGIAQAEDLDADWLVLCSEAMRFGEPGGRDFERRVITSRDAPWVDCGYSWHLIALRMNVIYHVGRFDETFWPAYYEDADYDRRLQLAGFFSPRAPDRPEPPVGGIDVVEVGAGHSIDAGLVSVDMGIQAAKYATKWGGGKGHEQYTTPYGSRDLTFRDVTLGDVLREPGQRARRVALGT